MAAPIDDMTTQKIFKAIEEQNDTLKKMGKCLTKLKVGKLKKPIHVEIHDEEKGKDLDERDKAKYERNKQFKRLIANTMAMKEKMELAFCKAQGMNDCLYNMGGISSKTPLHCLQSSRYFMWKSLMGLETQSNMLGDI